MLVIPAIDLKDGKCVRLFKGIESQVKVYDEDPIKVARYWQDQGSKQLHIIDLDGAFGNPDNVNVIKSMVKEVDMEIQVGGGIRTFEKAKGLFDIGVDRLIVGTSAMKDPEFVQKLSDDLGGNHVCVALDFREEKVLIKGWTEETSMNVFDAAKLMESKGAEWILFTSQEADGTLEGISSSQLDITKRMVQKTSLKVIAAGGITSLDDLDKLYNVGVAGSVIGKALYEKKIDIKEAFKKYP